jgi:predicted ATPase with chaperone activity
MSTAELETPSLLPAPLTLAEAGLKRDLVEQLMVKALHFAGELTGFELTDRLGLSFPAIEPAIDSLKAQRLVEIVGGSSLGPPSYHYRISSLGRERAGMFLDRNMYSGVAPVPLDQYIQYMTRFFATTPHDVTPEQVRAAFSHLVLSDRVLNQLGPAVNAGHSLFVYGPPGNGKTVISQAIRNLLVGDLWVPHALEVDGSMITIFDPINHELLPLPEESEGLETVHHVDRRWLRCKRPLVTVGGELVLDSLELTYNPTAGLYRAPIQLVANGGVLVIDDFGRQQAPPQALLNRWILPLEGRVDYLQLQSGQKIAVPFMVLPVFATNIRPADLVDEAFLRRIQYKVLAEDPTAADFALIFERVCRDRGLPFDPAHVSYLLDSVLTPRQIAMRGCQPRDLINQAVALAKYRGDPYELTTALLNDACASYFVEEHDGASPSFPG